MQFPFLIARRYLFAKRSTNAINIITGISVFGVAIGVFIFIFMSALIGGLAQFILSRTVGDIAHVTIQAEAADPALLLPADGVLLAQDAGDLHVSSMVACGAAVY